MLRRSASGVPETSTPREWSVETSTGRTGIEQAWIPPGFGQGGAHAGDVDERRPAGRVVHQDPTGQEGDLLLAAPAFQPAHDRHLGPRRIAAGVAQDVFQQDAKDVRQLREIAARRRRKINDPVAPPVMGEFGGPGHERDPRQWARWKHVHFITYNYIIYI